nr:aminodeoxychorismate/anthranilate synthase component II [uncultured Paludibaculum sp.]
MRVLVLDNYDSFTWNLVHALTVLGAECTVWRSDAVTLEQVADFGADRILLSPGPFGPERAGVCPAVVRALSGRIPILGVCLGMQVIASVAGARVEPSGRPVHGQASRVFHDGQGLFAGLPDPFEAARYHSLRVAPDSIPTGLEVSAWLEDGTVMGCRMKGRRTEGVLFHPESFLTPEGPALLKAFLQ